MGGPFDTDTDTNIFKATFGGMFRDISFGDVTQPLLSEGFLVSDLTVGATRTAGGDIGDVDLIYVYSNFLPMISPIADQTIQEDTSIGANRTLTLTPAPNQSGSTFITVTVRDADGGAASSTFVLQVGVFVPEAGDSNEDRQFNQMDLVLVLQAGKYLTGRPATFAEGDWNRDGIPDPRDIVAALQTNHYLQGPYAALAVDALFSQSE